MLRNASRVSSVCNDVVGDICGIVSGATGAVIVARLQQAFNTRTVLISNPSHWENLSRSLVMYTSTARRLVSLSTPQNSSISWEREKA